MVKPLGLIKFWSMSSKIVYLQSCHVNATFEFDTFPLPWKAAEVTTIPKAGDNIPNNNWPILLLPVLSKVCERVSHNQLSGNKQWHSMETSVIQTTDEILTPMDSVKCRFGRRMRTADGTVMKRKYYQFSSKMLKEWLERWEITVVSAPVIYGQLRVQLVSMPASFNTKVASTKTSWPKRSPHVWDIMQNKSMCKSLKTQTACNFVNAPC